VLSMKAFAISFEQGPLMATTAHSPFVRQLTTADLPDIVKLHEAVVEQLPAGFIRPKTENELRSYLDGTLGVAYGIIGNGLLAASLLRVPNENHPNDGIPFPLVLEEDWPRYACFLDNTMVLPAARGRGYQRILVDVRFSYAASIKMRWICAAVQVRNFVSWANLLAKGMAIVGMRFDLGVQSSDFCARSTRGRLRPTRAIKYRFVRMMCLNIEPPCKTDTSECA
jgi:hypothetical protein